MQTMYEYEQETFELPEHIISEEQAGEVLRQYKAKMSDIARAEVSAKKYLEDAERRVVEYTAKNIDTAKGEADYLANLLADWARAQIVKSGKRSVKLIDGVISFTKAQAKYERNDEEVIQFIKDLPPTHPLRQFLKDQAPKLDWAELKKCVKVGQDNSVQYDGTKIPGIIAETNLPDIVKIR